MSASHHATVNQHLLPADGRNAERLPIPEATMFIVASSGALWVLIFSAIRWLFG